MNVRTSQVGATNVLLIPLIMSVIFFFGATGFGVWAFMERQDYKNNSDQKAQAAADIAAKKIASEKDNEFIEKEKEPLRQYKGPSDLGSISFNYPKTWSGYVDVKESESNFIFHPHVVKGGNKTDTVYALRVTVSRAKYDTVVKQFDSKIKTGKAKATVYKLPKVPGVTGVRINGEVDTDKQGSVVILPLRDRTIKIFVESQDFMGDYNKHILPSFTFVP